MSKPESHEALIAGLSKSFSNDSGRPKAGSRRPRIVEEDAGFKGYQHIYVIWHKFAEIDEFDRSRIILEALDQAKGQKEMLRVSVAMGLTSQEARTLGIKTNSKS